MNSPTTSAGAAPSPQFPNGFNSPVTLGNNSSRSSATRLQREDSNDSAVLSAFVAQAKALDDAPRRRTFSSAAAKSTAPGRSKSNANTEVYTIKAASPGLSDSIKAEMSSRSNEVLGSMSNSLSSASSSQQRRRVNPPPPLDLSVTTSPPSSNVSSFATSKSLQDLQRVQHAHPSASPSNSSSHSSNSRLQPAQDISRTRTKSNAYQPRTLGASRSNDALRSGPKSASSATHWSSGVIPNKGATPDISASSLSQFDSSPSLADDLVAPSPHFMRRAGSSSSSNQSSPDLAASRHDSIASLMDSPQQSARDVDRSKLVGLGELSTPRWTAAGRSSWNMPFLPTWETSPVSILMI